jgi:hypothetical protein
MKRKISYLPSIAALMAFSVLLMTFGCKKSSSSSSSGGLSGSFSGTAFQPSLVLGLDEGSYLNVAGLQLKGSDSVGVLIDFPDDSPLNTGLSFSSAEIVYNDSKGTFDFESDFSPSHGIVTITTWDKTNLKIAGTYSGVIYDGNNDSVVITNGSFNTTYKQF